MSSIVRRLFVKSVPVFFVLVTTTACSISNAYQQYKHDIEIVLRQNSYLGYKVLNPSLFKSGFEKCTKESKYSGHFKKGSIEEFGDLSFALRFTGKSPQKIGEVKGLNEAVSSCVNRSVALLLNKRIREVETKLNFLRRRAITLEGKLRNRVLSLEGGERFPPDCEKAVKKSLGNSNNPDSDSLPDGGYRGEVQRLLSCISDRGQNEKNDSVANYIRHVRVNSSLKANIILLAKLEKDLVGLEEKAVALKSVRDDPIIAETIEYDLDQSDRSLLKKLLVAVTSILVFVFAGLYLVRRRFSSSQ